MREWTKSWIYRVFRKKTSYFRRLLNPSNIIQLKCHLAILYPTYVCIIMQICLALYELFWKQWMAKVKVAISQWTQMTNIAKNWLCGCLTFLIRKWELKMIGKPLSPFWNWESQENHNRGLLAPAHWNPDPLFLPLNSLKINVMHSMRGLGSSNNSIYPFKLNYKYLHRSPFQSVLRELPSISIFDYNWL